MQALEMEQVESLIGPGRRKVASMASPSKNKSRTNDIISALAVRRNFLTKVVVVACIALVLLLYFAAVGDEEGAITEVKKPQETPVASPTSDATPVAEPNPELPAPVNPPVAPPTDPSVASPIAPPTSPSTSESSPTGTTSTSSGGESSGKMDGEYMYSKYATIIPLVDHPLPDKETKQKLSDAWGSWHFWDGDEDMRPTDDYCSKYPNRDIPGDEFPEDAWQADAVFVNHYLNDADQLISRAMESIFTEYGHGKPLLPEEMAARMKMFHWSKEDLSTSENAPPKYAKRGDRGNGGWTTKRSFDGLALRLTHAMMTSDTFTVVMGGHSAAAAQGNHFRQSYMMQFHKIMEPIFARLGVKLITRNVGMGGMGTLQAAMGSGSLYGSEVDLLLWDSGMTEGQNYDHIDLFLRQGLMGGNRVPVLWGGNFGLLKNLHEHADADVGEFGTASDGIIEVESEEQAKTIPYAARFMKCKEEVQHLCVEEPRFCAHCWFDRDDGIKPEQGQRDIPRGQVKWHPGWRPHQLTGRNIAFAVLQGLQAAVNTWSEGVMGGPPLEDELWHVTDYYENIRTKVKTLDSAIGKCYNIDGTLPTRMCNTPMKARTQYTPRADFHESSLTSIIKPTADGYVPKNENKLLYDGPDVHNQCFDIPEGEIDVYSIVTGRRRLHDAADLQTSPRDSIESVQSLAYVTSNRSLETSITPGKGWEVWGEPAGYCDGTYNAVCGIQNDNECALYGHHDARGAVIGNEYSGWLVMTLEDLKEGVVVIKLHTWHIDSESTKTKGWKSVNNERARHRLGDSRQEFLDEMTKETDPSREYVELDESGERILMRSYDTPELPDTFIFEYAIDGQVTTLTKDQFLEQKKTVQRVVETLTLLDDPNFTSEGKTVEVAIRLRGCGRQCTFGLSHIYWA